MSLWEIYTVADRWLYDSNVVSSEGHGKGLVLSIMPKIPEILVGIQMEKSVSVSSDWNIRDHLWGGPLISVGILRPKFVVPFLTNRLFALIREFRWETNSGKSHSYWLARFNRKISFYFARKFPLISERSVSHNGKHLQLPASAQPIAPPTQLAISPGR